MASAKEIDRQQGDSGYSRIATVLVRPPILVGIEKVSEDLDRAVFGRDHENSIGSRTGVTCRQKVLLGNVAQIVEIHTFNSLPEAQPDQTCDLAVNSLHTYVTAMAEGDTAALQQFLPQ